jgi:hypothetical protein
MTLLRTFSNTVQFGDCINLQAVATPNNFLTVESDGRVLNNRSNAFEFETFRLEGYFGKRDTVHYGDYLFLRSFHGLFIRVTDESKMEAKFKETSLWETFRIVDPKDVNSNAAITYNSRIALETSYLRYICSENQIITAEKFLVKEYCEFKILKSSYNITGFKCQHDVMPSKSIFFHDVIKLKHVKTGNVLHSHNLRYIGGSQLQQVTCYDKRDDNDWWYIEPLDDRIGQLFPNSKIRLKHLATQKYLRTKVGILSPRTKQQEVSCHEKGSEGYDIWNIDRYGEEKSPIEAGEEIRLYNELSERNLHSHPYKFTAEKNYKQQEVTAYDLVDENDKWKICEVRGRLLLE